MLPFIFLVVAILIVAGFFFGSKIIANRQIYSDMCCEANLREFHKAFTAGIETALKKRNPEDPNLNDGTEGVTRVGFHYMIFVYKEEDEWSMMQIAMGMTDSSISKAANRGVCSRYGFFILSALRDNAIEWTPNINKQGICQLLIVFGTPTLSVADFDLTYHRFNNEYITIPFVTPDVEELVG